MARHRPYTLLKTPELAQQHFAYSQQRIGDDLQIRMPADQLLDPFGKIGRRGLSDLQTEPAQDPAQAHLNVTQLRLDQGARGQYRTRPMPRASLRSVFTGIVLNALRTCRVSNSSTGRPARFIAANNHCDRGPASSPIRVIARPRLPNHAISP